MKALTASITDRANPIFLQALRQSLRGRMFQILFWVTLLLAMAFSLLFVIIGTRDDGEPSGPIYFLWIYAALSFAVHLFVPFSAFLSLGNEWDENTYDLLVLSNLKPRQIVGGKLLSALLQAGLWFSAFGPFLTFSFLLPGLDLVALGLVMLLTAFSSTCLTCVALCLSAAARGRFVRTFLMAILGLFLSFVAFMAVLSAFQIVDNPTEIRSDFGRQMIIGFLTGLVVLGSYCFAFACTRLAHEEENRSSGLRVISSLVLVAVWWWLTSLYRMSGQQQEMILTTGMLGILLVTLFSVLYAHEDARLGRRVQLDIPRSRIGAFLSTPWLPGGARGILWHCLHLGVWVLALYLTCRIWPPTTAFLPEHSFGTGLVDRDRVHLALPGRTGARLSTLVAPPQRSRSGPRVRSRHGLPVLPLADASAVPVHRGRRRGDRAPGEPIPGHRRDVRSGDLGGAAAGSRARAAEPLDRLLVGGRAPAPAPAGNGARVP